MARKENLEFIANLIPAFSKELEKADEYDDLLIQELKDVLMNWKKRRPKWKVAYIVWFYNGQEWSAESEPMSQMDAYRIWYRLTKGGKLNNNSKCDTYYYLGTTEKPSARHEYNEKEEDFSIPYLLNKSFGS